MTYKQAIQYLYDCLPVFHHIGGSAYKPGLENTIKLLNKLNNPQNTYKTIHIAGTNGKGSTSHMLSAVLQEAGYKTALYTSPHLVDFGERIRVSGEKISQKYVVDFVEKNRKLIEEIQPSFFEATMAMAFSYFAHEQVEIAIIEAGLGGRLDSTNIINPELSVITNISFDHTGFLGETLSQIAFEKAGIIKGNTPVVIGEVLPETRMVFENAAESNHAPLIFAEEQLQIDSFEYLNGKMKVVTNNNKEYVSELSGIYQLKNIITVLTSVKELQKKGLNITEKDIQSGLSHTVELTGLMGRWQVMKQNPKIVLDTGHNTGGVEYIVRQLADEQYKDLRIVFGMVNDKDISHVLSLLPKDAVYYFTQAEIARALPVNELKKQANQIGLTGQSFISVKQAVEKALSSASENDLVFIGGSNFVVGEALAFLQI